MHNIVIIDHNFKINHNSDILKQKSSCQSSTWTVWHNDVQFYNIF